MEYSFAQCVRAAIWHSILHRQVVSCSVLPTSKRAPRAIFHSVSLYPSVSRRVVGVCAACLHCIHKFYCLRIVYAPCAPNVIFECVNERVLTLVYELKFNSSIVYIGESNFKWFIWFFVSSDKFFFISAHVCAHVL